VYSFTLAEPGDVTVDVASARVAPYVALQDACTGGTTLLCDSGWPLHRTFGSVPAGTYYLWVESTSAVTYPSAYATVPPTPPPAHDTCAGALDISAGGRFEGSLLSRRTTTGRGAAAGPARSRTC